MKQFLLRWMVNFLGLWTAATLVSGIRYEEKARVLLIAALVFSIVNAFVRPLIVLLTLPVILVTLGLFTLVINAFMLYLVALLYPRFEIASFGSALLAVIIIGIVNYLLNDLLEPKKA